MIYDTGYHYRYSFLWEGYTYKLQISNPRNEYVLLKFLGAIHDEFTSILETRIGQESILNFLIMENVPMIHYLEVEKFFMEKET